RPMVFGAVRQGAYAQGIYVPSSAPRLRLDPAQARCQGSRRAGDAAPRSVQHNREHLPARGPGRSLRGSTGSPELDRTRARVTLTTIVPRSVSACDLGTVR